MNATYNSDKKQPFAQWLEVDVTFPSTPDTDIEVPHDFSVADPDAINYVVLRKDRAGDVYDDRSATRVRVSQPSYLLLRCSVASLQAKLLLYVSHSR